MLYTSSVQIHIVRSAMNALVRFLFYYQYICAAQYSVNL